jgi:nucleoside-diphosphate-sugar epimerase
MLAEPSILITGGAGSFGKAFVKTVLQRYQQHPRAPGYSLHGGALRQRDGQSRLGDSLLSGETPDRGDGFDAPSLRRIERPVSQHRESLLRAWNEYFA